jgi:uncharacterized protein (TIGR02145 family)
MNQTSKLLTVVLMLFMISCQKREEAAPLAEEKKEVTINGTVYATVVIGKQTWLAQNYNGAGGVNYLEGINEPSYGKLYTKSEAMLITLPAGWRLPSREDYHILLGTLGETSKDIYGYYRPSPSIASKIMSTSSWENTVGNNESGFNALPTGYFRDLNRSTNPGFQHRGTETLFITSSFFTEFGGTWATTPVSLAVRTEIINGTTQIFANFSDVLDRTGDRGSLRFVKDN